MYDTPQGLKTHFASPERDSPEAVAEMAERLQRETTLSLLGTVPMAMVVVNRHRQILFCNDLFRQLSFKDRGDVLGLRPGEALDCIHADMEKAGCGCSAFCDVCGAARAIVKSLEGTETCEECRMLRRVDGAEVPLDLHVCTRPFDFHGEPLTVFFAMDVSHELRLRYLNRTFYHGLINGVGGIATLTELIEADPDDTCLVPLLIDSSRRTLKEVLYHRDLYAAENERLAVNKTSITAGPYLKDLIEEECRLRNIQPSRIGLRMEADDVTIFSDRRLLGHVLHNLAVNAMEAGETNPGPITLACRRSADGRTVLSLTNPGLIPETVRKQMFKRYASSKSRDRGLGTYVVKLLTEKYLNGEVRFESNDDSTTFELRLPATAPASN